MSTNTIREILVDLARTTEAPRDPIWVRGAWAQAKIWKDTTLLALLAARLDAPQDVVTEASKMLEIDVRVAYLCRTDRETSEVREALVAERRAGVLAGFCRNSSTVATYSGIIETHITTKPTLTLAEAIIATEFEKSPKLAALALGQVIKRWTSLTDTLRSSCDGALSVAAGDTEALNMVITYINDLTPDEREHLSQPIVKLMRAGTDSDLLDDLAMETFIRKPLAVLHAQILANPKIKPGNEPYNVRRASMDLEQGLAQIRAFRSKLFEPAKALVLSIDLGPFSPFGENSSFYQVPIETARAWASSSDKSDLEKLTELPSSANVFLDVEVFVNLLNNPHAAVVVDTDLVSVLGHNEELTRTLLHREEGKYAAQVYALDPDYVNAIDKMAVFSSPEEGYMLIAKELRMRSDRSGHLDTRRNYSHWGHSIDNCLWSFVDICEDVDALAELPWSVVDAAAGLGYWPERTQRITKTVAIQMERTIGADRAKWEAFVTLSNGFTGTIRELCEIATVL